MIKRFLAVLLLGAVLFNSVPAEADVINRLTGEVIAKDGVVYSGVPVWCFKFDDGRDGFYDKNSSGIEPWRSFTDKGIPITITINGSTIGVSSLRATIQQLKDILMTNRDQPVDLPLVELASHT